MTQFGVTEYVKDIARSFVTERTVTEIQPMDIPGFSIVKKDFFDEKSGTIVDLITVQSQEYYIVCDLG